MAINVRFLQRFALLEGLPEAELSSLASAMTLIRFVRRGVVLPKGELGPGLGFLLDGRLQGVDFTVDGREVGLYFVSPGECFGELAVIDGKPASEFVIALSPAQVLFLPHEAARKLMVSVPRITDMVLKRLASLARSATHHRTLLSLPNPMQRLCAQLLQLATPSAHAIDNAPTHQEIAIMINTSRETVTRALQLLQGQHILERKGSQLLLLLPDTLRKAAEGQLEQLKPADPLKDA